MWVTSSSSWASSLASEYAQRAADLREHRAGIPGHGEVDEGDASREGSLDVASRPQRQPRLADATWSGDRQEPHSGSTSRSTSQVRSDLPAHECRRLGW